MENPVFDEREMEMVGTRMVYGEPIEVLNTPVTTKENFKRTLAGRPLWQCSVNDYQYLILSCIPEGIAKGIVSDAIIPEDQLGGKDMFGITWEYEPDIGGATVRPGNPTLSELSEWEDKIVFPTKETIDSWDWAGGKKRTLESADPDTFWEPVITTGFFERLISFLDFQNALLAMIDEDQAETMHGLFDRLADLYIMIIDKYVETFPGMIDAVCLHDDWGHKTAPFFSVDMVMERVVPHMRKVTDHIHALGLAAEVHSCGKVDSLVPAYIAAGFDMHECQPLLDFDTVVPQYGEKIKFHVTPGVPAPDAPEAEQVAAAHAFVDQVIRWGQPVILETYYADYPIQPAYWNELYRYSRKCFAGQTALVNGKEIR